MNFLDKILDTKRQEIEFFLQSASLAELKDKSLYSRECSNFKQAIHQADKLSLIAEVKKASPSKGVLRENFDHIQIAEVYQSCNVQAISVLTDKQYFQGDPGFLKDIRASAKVPLLRKDFIINEIQIHQAKAFGADAILLISEILSRAQIQEFTCLAGELGLSVLLELHSEQQLEKIDFARNSIIGINNRNLESFIVDVNTSCRIAKLIPETVTIVSESGINSMESIALIRNAKIHAVLVGEYFMRADNLKLSVNEFLQWMNNEN
ncbi:MAG: indole-3-glycerol phosphate synthase TrpC [Ignavibacteria bacterium]|nr:indole-3-glycerol phosphate synthase TrpC [Ignavibacteria bacterium]